MMVFNRIFYSEPDIRFMNWMGGYEGNVYDNSELSNEEFMYQIANHMLNQDLKFQTKPREHRKEESDPHASHIQEYLFANKPLQSPEYVKLYTDIKSFFTKLGFIELQDGKNEKTETELNDNQIFSLKGKFQTLVQKWEPNHPDRQFIENETKIAKNVNVS